MDKIKRLITSLILLLYAIGVVSAQDRINEFVVTIDESHNHMTIYSSYGATPNDGVVIVNSTIPNLEFNIPSAPGRIRTVPDKKKNRYVLIIQPNDNNYKQYTITINAKGFKQGQINSVVVKAGLSTGYVVNPKYETEEILSYALNGHDYVDLGLPSGTLWATCNVGANSPEEYGDYFAWGETQPKATYTWSTYKWCNGEYNKLTKYCNESYYGYKGITDDLTTLQAGDDPARANWGGGWCTPTQNQWHELLMHTTNKWSAWNGVVGRLFTAKNGQTLFLPAAGYYQPCVQGVWVQKESSVLDWTESRGQYWSSSLVTSYNPSCAYHFYFDSGSCNVGFTDHGRRVGQSVRPVRTSQK